MKSLVIGTKWYGHDSHIFFLDIENRNVFGVSTERLTRYKHDTIGPNVALHALNRQLALNPDEVEFISICIACHQDRQIKVLPFFSEELLLRRKVLGAEFRGDFAGQNRKFSTLSPEGQKQWVQGCEHGEEWERLRMLQDGQNQIPLEEEIARVVGSIYKNATIRFHYFEHQLCHAVASWALSGFQRALSITSDGAGDGSFSRVYIAQNWMFECIASNPRKLFKLCDGRIDGNSLGNIYQLFTAKLGFIPLSDEGKVEALAAYGNWNNELYEKLNDSISFDQEIMQFLFDENRYKENFSDSMFEKYLNNFKKEDIAAAVQHFLEESTLKYISFFKNFTGIGDVCLSGGTTANVIANLRLLEEVVDNLFIIPAMNDAGVGMGATLLYHLQQGRSRKDFEWIRSLKMPYFGSSYSREEVLTVLNRHSNTIHYSDMSVAWPKWAAGQIAENKVGAIFQGRAEWGPRALGNRSIIANAMNPGIRDRLNLKIKKRPYFQPFCPSMLIDEMERLFDVTYDNPHMTCAFRMKNEFHSLLPGAIHIDGTSRVQWVREIDNPSFFEFLSEIKRRTGFGVVINTSFNKHGRTIVETPEDAIRDFLDTDLEFLVIEGFVVTRC